MESKRKEFRVFFSWQSDSPRETNANAIRKALKVAAGKLKEKHLALDIVLDEATRDTPGAPNIAGKIFEKIDIADVCVADVTTVTPLGAKRPSPNPNVLIELGYASAQAGWDRIILLFNDAIGNLPADLPFDIVQNRVSKYSIDPTAKIDPGDSAAALTNLLEAALHAVIEKDPKTPIQLRGMSPQKIQHARDVESLTWFLSQIHLPTLDDHIVDLPRCINDRIFWFWENCKGVVTNSLFHIYDPRLEEAIVGLVENWGKTLSFGERYHSVPGGSRYVFANPGDAPLDEDQEKVWNVILEARAQMEVDLQALLSRVREAYLEVDINQTNKKAWSDFVEFHTTHAPKAKA